MADDLDVVRDIFKKASVPLGAKDVWAVQGTPVVKHKALERLAASLRISYAPPQILRAERDEAVILVTGSIASPALTEWSIGEACVNVNYRVSGKQAAYVYAMAEKRGKDRVILKLAGLQGVYSEEESDELSPVNEGRDEPHSTPKARGEPIVTSGKTNGHPPAAPMSADDKRKKYASDFIAWLANVKNTPEPTAEDVDRVRMVWNKETQSMKELGILGTELEKELRSAWLATGAALARAANNPNAPAH